MSQMGKLCTQFSLALTLVLSLASCNGNGATRSVPGGGSQGSGGAAVAAASQKVSLQVPSGMSDAMVNSGRQLMVPPGFAISVYARIPKARFMALAPNGDLLVSQPSTGSVMLVKAGGGASAVSTFASGLNQPHDMVFHAIGGVTYLYVAQEDKIVRYTYHAGDTSGQNMETVVSGLPSSSSSELRGTYAHALKNIAIDGAHNLYVSVASATNEDPSDRSGVPERGAIHVYDAGKTGQAATAGRRFAHGIRNAEGLAFAPGSNQLWVVVNNRDEIPFPFHGDYDGDGSDDYGKVAAYNRDTHTWQNKSLQPYVTDHPPEEIIRVQDGADYGWPYCNPNPDVDASHKKFSFDNMPFVADAARNPGESKFKCSSATPITKGIQAHTAPLGLTFWTHGPGGYQNLMTTALHGCWNCSTYAGYKVIFYQMNSSGGLSNAADLVSGWLTDPNYKNDTMQSCQEIGGDKCWGRPVDTADLPDGSLLISDDFSGTIYRLYRK